ncbi:MAG: tRNA (adenosine(37)-N6)-threonylcarbamoyltransferase complex ATPase subunit type 1 TsaE [bacterium]|jgi:tRNA threonylcarbamoyladenosine biosynthesis protein TsaE
MNYTLNNINNAIEKILPYLQKYKVVLFNGTMGAGKTTLISALCKKLSSADDISSPTFSIVNEYLSNIGKIYHFDFYRIENIEEAFDIGLEEYLYSNDYCFIEWAEKIEELLPKSYLIVNISILSEIERSIEIIENN